jgi:hypothetical protein
VICSCNQFKSPRLVHQQTGKGFVLTARHGEILQKIGGAAIQIAKKEASVSKGRFAL